jgi:hypothetical protein
MVRCPYPERFQDQVSCKTESNVLYLVWHEGYEAHKFEMANLLIQIAGLAVTLETEVRNVQILRRSLEKQVTNLQKTKYARHS